MPDFEYADALPFDAVLQSGDDASTQEEGLSKAEICLLEDFRDYFRPRQPSRRKPSEPFICDHGCYRALQFDHFHLQSEMDMRDRFLIPPDGERFRVIENDGADFIRHDTGRPDVILVDGFDASGQPPQLCSPEFYDDCHRRLAGPNIKGSPPREFAGTLIWLRPN